MRFFLFYSAETAVDVYAGTYGFLRYQDTSGNLKDIFLHIEDGNEWIPAPQYLWKVVHNKDTNEAVAFISVNDPHTAARPDAICTVNSY